MDSITITMDQANALLADIKTPEALRELIAKLDVSGSGSITLFYSGLLDNGVEARDAAVALAKQNASIRIVDATAMNSAPCAFVCI
jgi:hypothetical protein